MDKSFIYVDGYAEYNNQNWIFEFLGCNFHHCPHCDTNVDKIDADSQRREFLKEKATHYIEMRECEWNKLKKNKKIPSADLLKWRNRSFTSDELLKMIKSGEFFGLFSILNEMLFLSNELIRLSNSSKIFRLLNWTSF